MWFFKRKKTWVLICLLSQQNLIDLSYYDIILHKVNPEWKLPTLSLTEEKYSDSCIIDLGESITNRGKAFDRQCCFLQEMKCKDLNKRLSYKQRDNLIRWFWTPIQFSDFIRRPSPSWFSRIYQVVMPQTVS